MCVAIATPLPQGNITQNDFFYTLNTRAHRRRVSEANEEIRARSASEESDYTVRFFLLFLSSFSWFSLTRAFTILPIKVYGMGLSKGNLKLPFSPS